MRVSVSLIIFSQKKSVVPSNMPGKITVLMISFLGFCYLVNIDILIMPFKVLVLIMILISAINYASVFLKNAIKKTPPN